MEGHQSTGCPAGFPEPEALSWVLVVQGRERLDGDRPLLSKQQSRTLAPGLAAPPGSVHGNRGPLAANSRPGESAARHAPSRSARPVPASTTRSNGLQSRYGVKADSSRAEAGTCSSTPRRQGPVGSWEGEGVHATPHRAPCRST